MMEYLHGLRELGSNRLRKEDGGYGPHEAHQEHHHVRQLKKRLRTMIFFIEKIYSNQKSVQEIKKTNI